MPLLALMPLTWSLATAAAATAAEARAEPLPDARAATAPMAPRTRPTSDPVAPAADQARQVPRAPVAPEEEPLPDPAAPAPSLRPDAGSPAANLARDRAPEREKIQHKGFVLQPYVGTVGCTRSVCSNNLGADPGIFVGGFVGGNVAGFFEIGLRGGWGRLRADVAPGQDVLALYGIDAGALEQQVAASTGIPLSLNTAAMTVTQSELSVADGALALRLHFVPRGRVAAYVGSGVGYQLFRGRFDTQGGPARLDFHGLQVPIEGGLDVYVVRHLALGARFDYRLTYYLAAALDHPELSGAVPFSALAGAADAIGTDLRRTLPHFWSVAATVRASF